MGRNKLYQITISLLMTVVLLLGILPGITTITYAKEATKKETIRVGFFEWDGYHIQDQRGIKSGYGYDFMKMAQQYNNWKYEYVGYHKSWSDMIQLLKDGKIDVLTSAQKTKEWEQEFDYSDSPIGTSSTILTVNKSDTKYIIGDTNTYKGLKVGLLKNSSRNKLFANFAKKKKFTYQGVYFESMDAMKTALKKGKINAIVSSNLRVLENETVLEEFEPIDFYAVVKKGNTKLLSKINHAIAQMDMNSPGWRQSLKTKYYSEDSAQTLSLNKEELSYINQLKKEKKVFLVTTNPDLAPYSYYENGEIKGIVPRIFKEIAKRLGIQYRFVMLPTYKKYNDYVKNGKVDIDLTCFSDYGLAEYHHVNESISYLSTSLSYVAKKSNTDGVNTVAMLKGAGNNTTYSSALFQNVKKKKYATNQECIDAVIDGTAEGTYMYTYAAQRMVENDVRNRLKYTVLPEYSVDMCIGVNEDTDYRLISILNEGIQNVKGSYAQKITQQEVNKITNNHSLLALLYDYPVVAIGIVLLVLLVISLLVIRMIRERNNKKEREQAKELSRFMGYVCGMCETVMEVNLDTLMCVSHNMINGELVSEEHSYEFAHRQNYNNTIHPEDFQRLIQEFQIDSFWELFENQEDGTYFEIRAKDQNGEYRWYSYSIQAIPRDKTHPNNFILFKTDIDDFKKDEEKKKQVLEDALKTAKMASSAKGQFLSRMSHEIRTPLNAVIGYMDIAKDSKDQPEKMMHCVENSDMAAKHLLSIINDVLDISSIENGKMKIANEEFDLKNQLMSISKIFFHQAKEKKVKFDVKIQDVTWEWVIGDSLRLNQILMNLLSNAVKFTPENGLVQLVVTQVKEDDHRVYMNFEVKDSGIGMSKEYQEKLFQPFEQESASTARKYGGTGLGLSITYNLVQMMGGSIEVQSEQNKGSSFLVSLFFEKGKKREEESDKPHDYSKIRALIVDDDKGSLEYMKALLKRCGVKSDVARNGKQAIRQIKRRMGSEYKYDICIMDWNMPEMDGIETARVIRSECKVDIPIIIATAYDVTEYMEQAKELGVSRIISKPLFQSTMFDILVSTFGKYEPKKTEEKKIEQLQGIHVLLAEDNEMNMEIAVEILTKAGIIVEEAKDGQEAVDEFLQSKEGTYDAILMDIQMPRLDGYEATKVIRQSDHKEAKTIPIIAMTANAFAEDVTAALASGMNGHVAKPINYDKLFTVLEEFIKK